MTLTFNIFAKPIDMSNCTFPAPMEVLNPFHEGQYKVHAWNLSDQRALLYDVELGNWSDFSYGEWNLYIMQQPDDSSSTRYEIASYGAYSPSLRRLFGTEPVLDTILTYDTELDTRSDASINLTPHLVDNVGHLLLALPLSNAVQKFAFWSHDDADLRVRTVTWLQSTRLGIETIRDRNLCVVKVSDLLTGAPVEGVSVRLSPQRHSVTTDEDGYSSFDLSTLEAGPSPVYARSGFDSSVLPDGCAATSFPSTSKTFWFAITDRNLYKPGETVNVKGWLRRVHYHPTG